MSVIRREKFLLITTALVGLIAGQIPSVYSAAYHGFVESVGNAVFGGLLAAVLMTLPTVAVAAWLSIKPTRFVAGVTVLYSIYELIRPYYSSAPLDVYTQVLLILISFLLLVLALHYINELNWTRFEGIFLAGFMAWVFSVPTIAFFQSNNVTQPTLSVDRILKNPPNAVVILVLDEMSVETVSMVRPILAAPYHALFVGNSRRAGKDTINAIPSMLTLQRHDDVTACGFTRLCGKTPFNMHGLRASHAQTDVVGFYHPYCAIQGLRSCRSSNTSQLDHPGSVFNFYSSTISRLFLINRFLEVERQQLLLKNSYEYIRANVYKNYLNAPFWSEGGLLYIHQLLPHPSGLIDTGQTLAAEYKINMHQTANFVGTLNEKLQSRFGKDYALIITTDHPLRTAMWCKTFAYSTPRCLDENPLETDRVPFLILAPNGIQVNIPETNVGLFSSPPLP